MRVNIIEPHADAASVLMAGKEYELIWVRRLGERQLALFHTASTLNEYFPSLREQTPSAKWHYKPNDTASLPINACRLIPSAGAPPVMLDDTNDCGFMSLRGLIFGVPAVSADHFAPLSALRSQLVFAHNFRFCPSCGGVLSRHASENALHCATCSALHYPPNHVAILCVVRDGDSLFLVRPHRVSAGYLTAIAGFVDVGETLDQCVVREVWEEAQMQVGNLRFVDSQHWCFPQGSPAQLMCAFTADYQSGAWRGPNDEIAEARWINVRTTAQEDWPSLPPPATLSRRLINTVCADILRH